MAADGPRADAATRQVEQRALRHRPAGPVVAVRRGDRRARGRVGMAATREPALMGGNLWERLARPFGPGTREGSESQRIPPQAGFWLRARAEILDRVSTGGA